MEQETQHIMPNNEHTGKRSYTARAILMFVLWLALIALDLWTKSAAAAVLTQNGPIVLIDGVLEFLYVRNTGAAFSLLENQQWLFIIIAVIVNLAILWIIIRSPKTRHYAPLRLVLVFVSAGAIGNVADRILLRYVRDFIYFSLINFPVFNVADIYVTVATVFLVILTLFYYKEEDFLFLFSGKSAQ